MPQQTTQQAWGYQTQQSIPRSATPQSVDQPVYPIVQITLPRPELAPDEVLVENQAIGINPVDWKFIQANPLNWPARHIPGVDGAGIVVAVGSLVDAALIGQAVAYHTALKHNGSFAQFTAVKMHRFMRLPHKMSASLAAALPCPMLTAWQAAEKIPVKAGARVLVAGLGAVNKILVQLLAQRGFVVDVLSRSMSESQAQMLGIHQVYRQLSAVDATYFAAFDAIGPQSAAQLVPFLQANGHIVCIQGRIEQPVDAPFTRTISYHEIALGALHDFGEQAAWQTLMLAGEELLEQVATHTLHITPPHCVEFSQLPRALALSEQRKEKMVVLAN